jgi:hypothetical protein
MPQIAGAGLCSLPAGSSGMDTRQAGIAHYIRIASLRSQ